MTQKGWVWHISRSYSNIRLKVLKNHDEPQSVQLVIMQRSDHAQAHC